MDIYGYFEIDIKVKKDQHGIFTTIFIKSVEIVGDCLLVLASKGQICSEFIEEGYDGIKYGIESLIGKKIFWSDFKKKKQIFLIKTAISISIILLTTDFSGFCKFKPQSSLKTVFIQVEKTIAKRVAIDSGTSVLSHFIDPDVMEKVFASN